jgi:hypothetical protein
MSLQRRDIPPPRTAPSRPSVRIRKVLRYDPETHEAVICSVWGQSTDWVRSIRVRPTLQVQIGRESFTPQQRILSGEEGFAVTVESDADTRRLGSHVARHYRRRMAHR